jgi:hypothetical protein
MGPIRPLSSSIIVLNTRGTTWAHTQAIVGADRDPVGNHFRFVLPSLPKATTGYNSINQ